MSSNEEEKNVTQCRDKSENEDKKKKRQKGIVTLSKLIREKEKGKKTIKYNNKGQPIGEDATKMMSYLGVLARSMIPIKYEKWNQVPVVLKEELIECLEAMFTIKEGTHKQLLSSAATKWRQFKSSLSTKYVMKNISSPELLKKPPVLYEDIITQDDWDDFVRFRVTAKFAKMREERQQLRAQHVYHHKLSRKGYAGLENEIKLKKQCVDEISRWELWKAARLDKDGGYSDDATRECASRIDDLTKRSEEGSISFEGKIDILTLALGKPEYSGRVRAVGVFVTPSSYFHSTRQSQSAIGSVIDEMRQSSYFHSTRQSQSARASVIDEMRQMIIDQRSEMDKMQAQLNSMATIPSSITLCSEKASCSNYQCDTLSKINSMSEDESLRPTQVSKLDHSKEIVSNKYNSTKTNRESTEKPCNLALGLVENVVAVGRILNNEEKNVTLEHVWVIVDVAMDVNARLPISPHDDMEHVVDAIGLHVEWPSKFVIPIKAKKKVKPKKKKMNEYVLPASVPITIRAIWRHFQRTLNEDMTLLIPLENEVVGNEFKIFCTFEDVYQFGTMQDISNTCIMLYMGYLYSMLIEQDLSNNFAFVDPSCVSIGPLERRSKDLAVRLSDGLRNQLFFCPMNVGNHWILLVIDPYEDTVYSLDPLRHSPRELAKEILNVSIKLFNIDKNIIPRKKTTTWNFVNMCPRQPGSVECGYYILRYMKDIISQHPSSINTCFKDINRYTQEDIDEVRLEWGDYVGNFM